MSNISRATPAARAPAPSKPAKQPLPINQADTLHGAQSPPSTFLIHSPVHAIPLPHDFGRMSIRPNSPLHLQAKLTVSSPGDSYEQEADQVAGKVMRMAEPVVQRKCACGGTCPDCRKEHGSSASEHGAAGHEASGLGPLEPKASAFIQTKRAGAGDTEKQAAPEIVHEVLRSSGQPLDKGTRDFMEPRFGHDFSQVRVHYDGKAAASARAVQARAYTVGRDIVFGEGQYATGSDTGRSLLAHELTHVMQQRNTTVMRMPTLDVDTVSADAHSMAAMPFTIGILPVSMLWLRYSGHASGEIAKAADYPTALGVPADKTKPVSKIPPPDPNPPLSNIPIEAHLFPTFWPGKGRALIVGGFHGDEAPGWQVTDALVKELSAPMGGLRLAFNTMVIPRLNAGAIEDQLAGVRMWRNRCNRQLVDLNRNFPTGGTPNNTDCANTAKAPIQPEVAALMNVIKKFNPDRILSTHAISTPASAGIFADPNTDPEAIKLARGMASTVANPSDIAHNKLGAGAKDFNPVYPLDQPGKVSGGTSLGAWAPQNANPGQSNTPVITMESPAFGPLSSGPASNQRTVEGALRPVHAFLEDPALLDTAADRDILEDIDAFTAADRIGLLTGKLNKQNDIFRRIELRVRTAVAKLNEMGPPTTISIVSNFRAFTGAGAGAGNTAGIDFEKFFLTGSRAGGWDTLPSQFFKNGIRSNGVDRTKWLATPSKDRLDIILRFSALPGTSRHHWGTDVDFNSVINGDWEPAVPAGPGGKPPAKPAGRFFALGQWLQSNGPKAGMIQAYTAGRTGGYGEEPWHFSYAPIAGGLLQRYNQQVNLQQDVIDPLVQDFTDRAAKSGQTVPPDFPQALKQINISDFVNNIGPGL